MSRFLDGPAGNRSLLLQRAPLFLRVVIKPDGSADALDMLADKPEPDETIHVYERVTEPSFAFIDYTHKGKRCGMRAALAEYRLYIEQPGDAVTRSNDAWRAWAEKSYRRHRLYKSP